jgi:8-oxo-dGTP pyrophosphatase MutT (NUDIX family)
MRTIRIYDAKDYEPHFPVYKRDSARAIIFDGDKLVMVRSEKYGDYSFPGGGIEKGETTEAALEREVLEETGYRVRTETIRPYGHYLILRRGVHQVEIFEQDNFYYTCQLDMANPSALQLDDGYETEYDYRVVFATLEEAIAANEKLEDNKAVPWVPRELYVLRELAQNRDARG